MEEFVEQKNRVLDSKMSCNCKESTDNILIMCTEIGVKTTHTDISDVRNRKKSTNYTVLTKQFTEIQRIIFLLPISLNNFQKKITILVIKILWAIFHILKSSAQ